MPYAAPRPCPKCGTLTTKGYCDAHKPKAWRTTRTSRHARGYGTAWDKLRKQILMRDKYLCQECLRKGRPIQATNVDHIRPKSAGGTDDPKNLQSLCELCHREKTARE